MGDFRSDEIPGAPRTTTKGEREMSDVIEFLGEAIWMNQLDLDVEMENATDIATVQEHLERYRRMENYEGWINWFMYFCPHTLEVNEWMRMNPVKVKP